MITKITLDSEFTHRYLEDCQRIQRVLLEMGYSSNLEDCAGLWSDYSDSMAAGWLYLDQTDEYLKQTLKALLEK